MLISLSILNSKNEPQTQRRLISRLLLFILPYLVLVSLASVFLILTGEVIPSRFVAQIQSFGIPILYLTKFGDHSFSYKIAGTQWNKPNILIIGPSRVNQWRSAMFAHHFYNAAQAVYSIDDYTKFLEKLSPPYPRIIIFSIDFYNFIPAFNALYLDRSMSDLDPFDPTQLPFDGLVEEIISNPLGVFDISEPLYGIPAIGLQAQRLGMGFRNDGSFQYGAEISGDFSKTVTVSSAIDRVRTGTRPFLYADELSKDCIADLARFIDAAKKMNIKLIGLTMPYHPQLVNSIENSPNHREWRQFRTNIPYIMKDYGVRYYDFTDIKTFDGRDSEFIDPFHASEKAYLRILLKMSEDQELDYLLGIDQNQLIQALEKATDLEVYRNNFQPARNINTDKTETY